MEWAEKAENRAIAHRKMLEAVLANPDNEPERALQRKLKVRKSKSGTTVRRLATYDDALGAHSKEKSSEEDIFDQVMRKNMRHRQSTIDGKKGQVWRA